jgi:hypothetical protein
MFYVMACFLFRRLVNKKENGIALGCHPFLWVAENVSTPKALWRHGGGGGGGGGTIPALSHIQLEFLVVSNT